MTSHRKLVNLVTAALMAAAIAIMTAYLFHVPIPGTSGYVHFGDALIYLTAAWLPAPYAMAAAALGGGLADLLTAPMWLPATVILKAAMVLPFTSRGEGFLCRRNCLAAAAAGVITVGGYYVAEAVIFGGFAAFFASITGNLIQGIGSGAIFLVLGSILDRVGLKRRLLAMA